VSYTARLLTSTHMATYIHLVLRAARKCLSIAAIGPVHGLYVDG